MNLTPKARFQQSENSLSAHKRMIESKEFERAADFAMLEYQRAVMQSPAGPGDSPGANYFRLLGAQEFLQQLRNLADQHQPVPRIMDPNLNHAAQ